MKTKSLLLSAFVASIGLVACEVPGQNETQLPTEEPKTFTVQLGVGGEISTVYNPLTRFTPDDRDIYRIQIWHKPSSETSSNSYEPYAYGLFDNLENARFEVQENYDYAFEVVMIDDAKDKIFCDSLLVDSNFYLGYDEPFRAKNNYNGTTSSYSITKLTNEFTMSSDCYFESMYSSSRSIYYKLKDGKEYYHPRKMDVYYGQASNYTPTEDNTQISIYLKRMNYGLKVVVGDFFDRGVLTMEFDEYIYTLTPDNKVVEDVFAYSNVGQWYKEDDVTNANGTGYIDFIWKEDDGTTIADWKPASFYYYRLKQVVLNLNWYGKDDIIGTNSFVIHYEDTPIEEGYWEGTFGDKQDHYVW